MKRQILISLLLILIMVRCGSKKEEARDFIPGTYVRYGEGEYSKVWDTLRISLYDQKGNTYVVQKHTGFQRIREGRIQPKEYTQERMMTVFDPSTGQLQDLKSGKLFVFVQEKRTVLMGATEYHKVE